MLLVSGRKKEALECAKEGQLWGPALVLASQLGDKVPSFIYYFYEHASCDGFCQY